MLQHFLDIPRNVLLVLAAVLLALAVGSVVRVALARRATPAQAQRRIDSLKSWWVMYGALALAVLLGRLGAVSLVGLLSLLGLREYLTLVPPPESQWRVRRWAYAAVILNYLWVYLGWHHAFVLFIPVIVFLWLPTRMLLTGNTRGFVRDVSDLHWGLMLIVFCLSHGACLLALPPVAADAGDPRGWFMYLILLTETNDIAQALWGRKFGATAMLPGVSPHKTWEGFLAGIVATLAAALLLAAPLTPLASQAPRQLAGTSLAWPYLWVLVSGLLIALGGFFGDVTMSAVKRDMGVKDAGTLVPGQGGILDRVDSLTFTAPIFFYFVWWVYYPPLDIAGS